MTRHDEVIALRVRAERCTEEVRALRARVEQLEQQLDQARKAPDEHMVELVDLSISLVEWERLPWWRRVWSSPRSLVMFGGAS